MGGMHGGNGGIKKVFCSNDAAFNLEALEGFRTGGIYLDGTDHVTGNHQKPVREKFVS